MISIKTTDRLLFDNLLSRIDQLVACIDLLIPLIVLLIPIGIT